MPPIYRPTGPVRLRRRQRHRQRRRRPPWRVVAGPAAALVAAAIVLAAVESIVATAPAAAAAPAQSVASARTPSLATVPFAVASPGVGASPGVVASSALVPSEVVAVARVGAGRVPPVARVGRVLRAGQPGGEAGVTYVPPVVAPVTDAFRLPDGPFRAGNRGIEYDTDLGQAVGASADGTVVFAGQVGGALHVTLRHADGVRTSYSFLASIDVVTGQSVHQGDTLGAAGELLHLGARIGDAYVDPASLFASATDVALVPFEVPPGSSPDEERRAIAELAFDGSGAGLGIDIGLPDLPSLSHLPGLADLPSDSTLDWLRDRAEATYWYYDRLDPVGVATDTVLELGDRLLTPGPCDDGPPPTTPVAGADRVAVTVAGLGTSATSGSIDDLRTGELGYDDDRVVRFSYAGGRAPGTGTALDLPTTAYGSGDTQGDLRVAGDRLADLVDAVLADDPDATVDLLAHSQGGVVARLALVELERRGADLSRLGTVATLGSPHRGADLATAVLAANTGTATNLALDAVEATVDTGIDPDAEAVRQLAQTSDVIDELAVAGVPAGVDLVSIAARGDWVVAAPATEVDGATNVTVPVSGRDAHGDLVGSDAATAELARALARRPPGCEGVGDVLADVTISRGIATAETVAGYTGLLLGP
ncbi:MAG TPA: peptidoglycan DD-metalloendopeptidase family protein [Acidimicrobiales bacterium]|nr:peptidoglycan DD-metalloendopeptidase family protein [Acidimicrobiales bacterium]